MEITLSWDLFIIVFFAVVITYSFIIGMHESVKIIVATYIAIVSVQGIGNILARVTGESQPILSVLGVTVDISILSTTKLILFIAAIIFLAIRGGLEVEYAKETSSATQTGVTAAFGFATAGLLLSTILTYVADAPLLDSSLATQEGIATIAQESTLMGILIQNQDIWFALPALLLLAVGFLNNE